MPKPLTHATSKLTEPVPASGVMSMNDEAMVHIELNIDLSQTFVRGALTRDMSAIPTMVKEALNALFADLAPKFAAGFATTSSRDSDTTKH